MKLNISTMIRFAAINKKQRICIAGISVGTVLCRYSDFGSKSTTTKTSSSVQHNCSINGLYENNAFGNQTYRNFHLSATLCEAPTTPHRQTLKMIPPRSEQVSNLSSQEFDVLIVGGGATGCGAALDATTRGLSTVLIERGDFGNETSARSTKLLWVSYYEAY